MASGDLEARVPSALHDDELGALASGLDDMRVQLAQTLEKVTALNADLEHRVEERTRDLQAALHHLKTAQTEMERAERMAALGAMVAGISHELNTPIGNSLTVASTLVELSEEFQAQSENSITRKGLRDYTQATADAAAMLMRNLGKAAQLIGSFKQVAVDRTVAHRREFALDTVLQETLTTLIAVLRRKGHVIESELEAGIVMDSYPGQLGQALTNIVQNADLHGLEGRSDGRIRVQSRALSADEAEIRISDNGKGIAPEHIRRIFDPFFTTKMGRGGSGLGLNIVHNLVRDVLGGHVDVDSIPGTGTTFVITLPRRAPSALQSPVPDAPAD
jgi:signal transduction histidine kinase